MAVYAWGANQFGQIGDGSTVNRASPVEITVSPPAGVNVKAVSAGASHSLALLTDGTVMAWGNNQFGQLGVDSGVTAIPVPTVVGGLVNVKAIAAGGYISMALDIDGKVWVWGNNSYGELGDNSSDHEPHSKPTMAYIDDVDAIAAGQQHCLALKKDGTVWAWGSNSSGELGDETTTDSHIPIQVTALSDISIDEIACGSSHSVALGKGVGVYAWGRNEVGQVGNGTEKNVLLPALVRGLEGAEVTHVAAGGFHGLALYSNGRVMSWGYNGSGQLGVVDVDENRSLTAVEAQVPITVKVNALAGGAYNSVALAEDATVWTWGHGEFGALGNGEFKSSSVPIQIPDFRGVSSVDAHGGGHVLALVAR
ncbi:RCC1 domain-containing protein [Sorangium sp. So ce394]|uniref:RCC1 domain-containing protein n=1 Tax=Sorangium sp. So ce394 TaxID=3133310 RepID=UPI003F5CA172